MRFPPSFSLSLVLGARIGVERELVYIVETDEGQETLSPETFAAKYGWKNDPSKVTMTPEPSQEQPAKSGAADQASPLESKP
jgi:hypothetical protein